MSGAGRFRYPLEPVALTRQWALDALLLALGDSHAALAAGTAQRDQLRAQLAQAAAEWSGLGSEGQHVAADQLLLATRYVGDCSRRLRAAEQQVQQLQQDCDGLAAQVVAAQRAVDATEEHRAGLRRVFLQQRQSVEFKIADDQWNVKLAGAKTYDD